MLPNKIWIIFICDRTFITRTPQVDHIKETWILQITIKLEIRWAGGFNHRLLTIMTSLLVMSWMTLRVENQINSFVTVSWVHCTKTVVPNHCLMSHVKCFHIEIGYKCRPCDKCFNMFDEWFGHLQIKYEGSELPCTIWARKAATNRPLCRRIWYQDC